MAGSLDAEKYIEELEKKTTVTALPAARLFVWRKNIVGCQGQTACIVIAYNRIETESGTSRRKEQE